MNNKHILTDREFERYNEMLIRNDERIVYFEYGFMPVKVVGYATPTKALIELEKKYKEILKEKENKLKDDIKYKNRKTHIELIEKLQKEIKDLKDDRAYFYDYCNELRTDKANAIGQLNKKLIELSNKIKDNNKELYYLYSQKKLVDDVVNSFVRLPLLKRILFKSKYIQ